MDFKEFDKRLENIEKCLVFFSTNYKFMQEQLVKQTVFSTIKNSIEPIFPDLVDKLKEFNDLYIVLNDMVRKESIIGTLSFMSKRIYEMGLIINTLKEEGINKKIHLDFTVDGYEMVKKKSQGVVSNVTPEEHITNLLDVLSEKQRTVLIHRYGLFAEAPKTYREIGEVMGLNRERIRQMQDTALRKLRNTVYKKLVNRITHKKLKQAIIGVDQDDETTELMEG